MTATLRMILILISCMTAFCIVRKIRQSSLQIEDSLFWICFVAILMIFSIFPQVPTFLSGVVGTMAPVNFIYLLIIFLLIVQLFRMTVHQSQLEAKLRSLIQEIAMDRNEQEKAEEQKAEISRSSASEAGEQGGRTDSDMTDGTRA
ncbi:hypothetical protein SAMN04487771_103818 [[Clostridium] aminophilum]|uniref:DUF2304 domain-containing protein n=1 Tax=[Clostridium] aminophilum TaxID=1526 RepID=A0A1I0GUC7_9FIRM|nr:DUF2304 domain-containing protein [[Clostridium] aminophilum]SET74734.1 hypothetical protein SAMN04487771_103818 [[Clostridium] aminophilum]